MDIYSEINLLECPVCGGPGLLEEENGWNWYVMCLDCGSHTAGIEYNSPEESPKAARKAADLWNLGKVIKADPTE